MTSQLNISKNKTRQETPPLLNTPTHGIFESHSSVVQSKSDHQLQQPNLKTSLIQAEKYGHHLSKKNLANQSAPKVVQAKPDANSRSDASEQSTDTRSSSTGRGVIQGMLPNNVADRIRFFEQSSRIGGSNVTSSSSRTQAPPVTPSSSNVADRIRFFEQSSRVGGSNVTSSSSRTQAPPAHSTANTATTSNQPNTANKKPRPKSWHEMDRTNQSPEFQEGLGIMREALKIDPTHRNDPKIGFPFSHFDHAFGTNEKTESMIVKGGTEHERTIQTPKHTTDVERITPMLPNSLTQGGHLEHQLRQEDKAKASSSSSSQNPVTMDRVREASVGVKFAKDTGLSLDKLRQPSAQIDFESETPSGKKVEFDPFTSPQPEKPTAKQLLGQKLVDEGTITERQNPQKRTPVNQREQKRIDTRWVNNAFTDHTNETKGNKSEENPTKKHNVIGLWDQTSDSQQRVEELKQSIKDTSKNPKPNLREVDLKLDQEYVKEDMQARRDLAKRKRRKSI